MQEEIKSGFIRLSNCSFYRCVLRGIGEPGAVFFLYYSHSYCIIMIAQYLYIFSQTNQFFFVYLLKFRRLSINNEFTCKILFVDKKFNISTHTADTKWAKNTKPSQLFLYYERFIWNFHCTLVNWVFIFLKVLNFTF